jgi:hypothetical protein
MKNGWRARRLGAAAERFDPDEVLMIDGSDSSMPPTVPTLSSRSETIRAKHLDVSSSAISQCAFARRAHQAYETWDALPTTVVARRTRSAGWCWRRRIARGTRGRSDALCTALQLVNFWQDLERDWANGRLLRATVHGACGRRAHGRSGRGR